MLGPLRSLRLGGEGTRHCPLISFTGQCTFKVGAGTHGELYARGQRQSTELAYKVHPRWILRRGIPGIDCCLSTL